jgi:hypothetical protein
MAPAATDEDPRPPGKFPLTVFPAQLRGMHCFFILLDQAFAFHGFLSRNRIFLKIFGEKSMKLLDFGPLSNKIRSTD